LISEFKRLVAEKTTVPIDRMRLIYKARVLEDDKKLSEYVKQDDEVVHLMA